jgi:hypothetical protein
MPGRVKARLGFFWLRRRIIKFSKKYSNTMKKKVLIGLAAAAVAAAAAVNVNYALQGNDLHDIALINVEALANAERNNQTSSSGSSSSSSTWQQWWDSKVYNCEQDNCSVSIGIITWYGKYEKCKSGSTVAHCWDCASCDAISS